MIAIKDQIALQFNIGNITDFLDIEDFHYMRIAENSGGLRPILNMAFTVTKEGVVNYLNSGNVISLMYGTDKPTSDLIQFEVQGDSKNNAYHLGSKVTLCGAMYKPSFTSNIKSKTYKGKSYEVINLIAAQNGMKFISNVNKTNDNQTWYQSGIKDWTMLNQVASRAYKDTNTFFAYAFDNNAVYFYDIKEQLKSGAKWILSVTKSGANNSNVVNIGSYLCDDSNAGTNAELVGKNVTNIGYNLDTGEISNPKHSLRSYTTMNTRSLNINSNGCQNYNYMITTGDEHAYTMEALNQNKRNCILFSSYNVYVPVTGQYRDFKLLDCVQLVPAESDPEAEGLYFITGIAKEYKNQQFTTLLTLSRESANGLRGEHLEAG